MRLGILKERLEATKPDVVKQFIEERLPRKFLGKAEELIPMIIFVCSDAGSMMGGCLVPIDAGEERRIYPMNEKIRFFKRSWQIIKYIILSYQNLPEY